MLSPVTEQLSAMAMHVRCNRSADNFAFAHQPTAISSDLGSVTHHSFGQDCKQFGETYFTVHTTHHFPGVKALSISCIEYINSARSVSIELWN